MEDNEVKEAARKYTYDDYLSRDDDDARYELIDGVIYLLASPARVHQGISGELYVQLHGFLKGRPCKVYYAPFTVRLSVGQGADTVLEPDLVVVCDESILDKQGCVGAPDLVIEILSPSTSKKDMTIKFNKYLQHGVKEYWIVDPDNNTVIVHILKDGEYYSKAYDDSDTIPVHVLEGCKVYLPDVFQ